MRPLQGTLFARLCAHLSPPQHFNWVLEGAPSGLEMHQMRLDLIAPHLGGSLCSSRLTRRIRECAPLASQAEYEHHDVNSRPAHILHPRSSNSQSTPG